MAKIAAIRNRPVQDEKPGWRRYLQRISSFGLDGNGRFATVIIPRDFKKSAEDLLLQVAPE